MQRITESTITKIMASIECTKALDDHPIDKLATLRRHGFTGGYHNEFVTTVRVDALEAVRSDLA